MCFGLTSFDAAQYKLNSLGNEVCLCLVCFCSYLLLVLSKFPTKCELCRVHRAVHQMEVKAHIACPNILARKNTLECSQTIQNIVTSAECPVCVERQGTLSCCGRGASWHGKCGSPGNSNYEHTWHEGVKACANSNKNEATLPGCISSSIIFHCGNVTRTAVLVTLTCPTFPCASQSV